MNDPIRVREALLASLPADVAGHGHPPQPQEVYVPRAHLKALRPEASLVVGTRGAGKSLWTMALRTPETREALGSAIPALTTTRVAVGFSERQSPDDYPNADTIRQLLKDGEEPYDLWRGVIARHLSRNVLGGEQVPLRSWGQTLQWMRSDPEGLSRLVQDADKELATQGEQLLFVFDALDRASADWDTMDALVRGLLQAVLWLKPQKRMYSKVFLREDQFRTPVTNFPDASKLLATQVDLSWARHDLHGLLWQLLINGPGEHGDCLRETYHSVVGTPPKETPSGWRLPSELQRDNPSQRALFEALAGPWMGTDPRRGVPYVWTVSHLADGHGRTSPRSFLVAIRQAAEDSLEHYPDHPRPLHYESIKRGVRAASKVRVHEISEVYPWVERFMGALEGMNVPCAFQRIAREWEKHFPQGPETTADQGLPPRHTAQGWEGLRDDLLDLGIFEQRKDGRIDMPDLYRVGFGLGRKGGVPPRR
ncbi:MAG: hypothetical protein ACLFRW_05275 [Halorhodospira sp.]